MSIVDTSGNTSFSKLVPGLQLAVDSTSLGEFKTCPRRYYYSIICGYQPRSESVHLRFGILIHEATEKYDRLRAEGVLHEAALTWTVLWVLKTTWNRELGRAEVLDDPNKSRLGLLRTVVWYLDAHKDDSLQTVILASGKPAVELSFQFDSGYRTEQGEVYTFCGHLDRIAQLNSEAYIVDKKTTKHTLSAHWFDQFAPHNQFSMYLVAGDAAFGVPVRGLIVDGIQVAVTFSRFERHLITRDDGTLEEWYKDAGIWLAQMEVCAQVQYWPMNDKACDLYGGCAFRPICAKPPGARDRWLQADYRKRVWDPQQKRGDI